MLQNLQTPGTPPIAISPAGGYGYVPAFCGNGTIYYSYSTTFSGTYNMYKWTAGSGVSVPMPGFSGVGVASIAVARSDGDGGLHVCP
jgi:hypothetical protein